MARLGRQVFELRPQLLAVVTAALLDDFENRGRVPERGADHVPLSAHGIPCPAHATPAPAEQLAADGGYRVSP
jgi:hypothetical protein